MKNAGKHKGSSRRVTDKEIRVGGGGVGVGLSTGCFCVSTVKNMFSSPVQGDNSVAVA